MLSESIKQKIEESARKSTIDLKRKLFPLRINCWLSNTHEYQCGTFDGFKEGAQFGYALAMKDSEHLVNEGLLSQITALEETVKKLEVNLNVCKNDYWFMANILEHYSSDKEQAIKDCIDRMKFREPIFKILDDK
jgi:hypothetical protein